MFKFKIGDWTFEGAWSTLIYQTILVAIAFAWTPWILLGLVIRLH